MAVRSRYTLLMYCCPCNAERLPKNTTAHAKFVQSQRNLAQATKKHASKAVTNRSRASSQQSSSRMPRPTRQHKALGSAHRVQFIKTSVNNSAFCQGHLATGNR